MAEGDLYEGENKMTCCLKKGKHHLKCIDAYHDDWHGSYIAIDGEIYCHGFLTGHTEENKFTVPVHDTTHTCENYNIYIRIGENGGD